MTTEENNRNNKIITILSSIDKRLELIVKILGYMSIFIITPSIFALSYFGVDVNSILGIKELTPVQKELVAELRVSGWRTDSSGALTALRNNDPVFGKFIRAEIYPSEDAAGEAIRELILEAKAPAIELADFQNFLRQFPGASAAPLALLSDANGILDKIARGKEFSTVEEYCEFISPLLKSGNYAFRVDGNEGCIIASSIGTQMSHLMATQKAIINWNDLFKKLQPSIISNEGIINLSAQSWNRELNIDKFNLEHFFSGADGKMYRYDTLVNVFTPGAFWDQTGAWGAAILDQVSPKTRGGFLPVAYFKLFGDANKANLQMCEPGGLYVRETACAFDFVAIKLGDEMHIASVSKLETIQNREFVSSASEAARN